MPWLIDDSLNPRDLRAGIEAQLMRARGPKVPVPIAMRLDDVVVNDNRRWFGGADIRLDTLVVHGGGRPMDPESAVGAATQRFSRISDGERLSIDRFLAFHGVPRYFVDISILVVRDRADTVAMATLVRELFKKHDDAGSAIGDLARLLGAANPTAALIGAGISAARAIADLALATLQRRHNDAIGLYRTSWLESENFGIGERHHQQAQGLSFTYELIENPGP